MITAGERRSRWRTPLRVTIELLLFGVVPLAFLAVLLTLSTEMRDPIEFKGNIWLPGRLILEGKSPYDLAAVRHAVSYRHAFAEAVYPPSTHVVTAPLAALPLTPAFWLFTVTSVIASLGALRLIGVMDWRCYGIALVTVPLAHSFALGGITSFLLLACAAAWRYRERPVVGGVAMAAAVALKLFLWPLLVWFVLRRQWKMLGVAAVTISATLLIGAAAIRFQGVADYPEILRLVARQGTWGYSSIHAFGDLGLDSSLARSAAALSAIVLVGLAMTLLRVDDGRASFALMILVALVLTPVVWSQYFALLLVPVALMAPRLNYVWSLPLAFIVAPEDNGDARGMIIGWGTLFIATAMLGSSSLFRKQRRFVPDGPITTREPLPATAD